MNLIEFYADLAWSCQEGSDMRCGYAKSIIRSYTGVDYDPKMYPQQKSVHDYIVEKVIKTSYHKSNFTSGLEKKLKKLKRGN